ncbi:hypothetical protein BDZ94DRAFT_1245429 [Collybia nuda]|uniref:Uncharacterized protein n=1 Tax=Collybia nuda TaxID=64659 RepID=A0A9P5YFQ5_9AGAR|nr:hypothetical protein BDZ94DRAFT_1245429 [Collybia nuda]
MLDHTKFIEDKPWLRAWPWPGIPPGQSPLELGQSQGFQAKPGLHITSWKML